MLLAVSFNGYNINSSVSYIERVLTCECQICDGYPCQISDGHLAGFVCCTFNDDRRTFSIYVAI